MAKNSKINLDEVWDSNLHLSDVGSAIYIINKLSSQFNG